MSYLETNQNLLRRLALNSTIIDQLMNTAQNQNSGDLIGTSNYSIPPSNAPFSFKRGFFTTKIKFEGIPLGVKLGDNIVPGIELAGIAYLHAKCENLVRDNLLPRIFGTFPERVLGTAYPIIVMEDFSEGATRKIETTEYQHPSIKALCHRGMPVEQTTFAAVRHTDTRYPVGDFDGLYGLLEPPHNNNLMKFAVQISRDPNLINIL
jgi:hypothetical protein